MPGVIRIARGETLRAARGGLRPCGRRERRQRRHDHLPPHPSEHDEHAARAGDGDHPGAIIGEAVLSFLGLGVQPPTPSWGVMLQDAQSYLARRRGWRRLPGPRDRALRRSRSTCSATACATSSIRGRRADDRRCWRSPISRSGSTPTTGRCTPSTSSRSRSTAARCSGSSASRAAARASPVMSLVRLLPETARDQRPRDVRRDRSALRCRPAAAARSAAATSPSSSRSR